MSRKSKDDLIFQEWFDKIIEERKKENQPLNLNNNKLNKNIIKNEEEEMKEENIELKEKQTTPSDAEYLLKVMEHCRKMAQSGSQEYRFLIKWLEELVDRREKEEIIKKDTERRIDEVKTKIEAKTKDEIEKFKSEAGKLKSEKDELKADLSKFKTERDNVKRESNELKLELNRLKMEDNELTKEVDKLKAENTELQTKLENIRDYVNNIF